MPTKSAGFTLIEIILAISILVLIFALAVPNLVKFSEDQRLLSDINSIKSSITQAQTSASTGVTCSNGTFSTSWSIKFDSPNSQFYLLANCEPLSPTGSATTDTKSPISLSPGIIYKTITCPTPPSPDIPSNQLTFTKTNLTTGADCVINLQNTRNNSQVSLTIDKNSNIVIGAIK